MSLKLAAYRFIHRLPRGTYRLESWFRRVPGLRLPRAEVEVSTAFGTRIRVNPSDNTVEYNVYVHGVYESTMTSLLMAMLPGADVFWDVGAHIGYYTLLGSRVMAGRGRVLAFEPHPRVRARLESNVAAFGGPNISVLDYGLSDDDVEREIFDEGEGVTGAPTFVKGIYGGSGHRCRLRTGDGLVAAGDEGGAGLPAPDVIKLDIEGYENKAFRGLSTVLSGDRPPILLFEINRIFNDRPEGMLDELAACNDYRFLVEQPVAHSRRFTFRKQFGDGPIPRMIDLDRRLIPRQCNVIAYCEGRHGPLLEPVSGLCS